MLQAYWREGHNDTAVFSLFSRRLPPGRNFLLACGLDDALHGLEQLRFDDASMAWLRSRAEFGPEFLEWLQGFRCEGPVFAVPEGTPMFADEPLIEVVAPLPQAQLRRDPSPRGGKRHQRRAGRAGLRRADRGNDDPQRRPSPRA